MKKWIFITLLALCFGSSYAKDVSVKLLTHPEQNAKALETITDLSCAAPFYRQDGWIKLADHCTGKAGWIQKEDWQQANLAAAGLYKTTVTASDQDDSGKAYTKTITYIGTKELSDEQVHEMSQTAEKEQQKISDRLYQSMQQMMALNQALIEEAFPRGQPASESTDEK